MSDTRGETGLPADYPLDDDREVTPAELRDRLQGVRLIDCRLPREHELTRIRGGGELMPVQEFDAHLPAVAADQSKPIVVYCRSGQRSLAFVQKCRAAGVPDVKSLAGGVLAWNAMTGEGPQY